MGPPEGDWEEPRPWKRAGAVRRDCESHRGNLLFGLSLAVWIAAAISMLMVCMLVVVVPLALVVLKMADRDLARMAAGDMDPAGRPDTVRARSNARSALVIGFIWPLAILVVVLLCVLILMTRGR